MHRFLAALCALLLASCGMDESASPRSETRSWAPRLSYANGATVPKVDYVRLVVTLQDGKGTVLEQQVDWSQGKVVVNGIPSGVAFTAQVKGVLQDGSEVWSGSTDVGSGESGDVAITSKVTVSSAVGIDLALDETALTSPAAGSFPRVLVKNWPYADTDIHVLYTTDESVPTYGMSSTHEYAGPFTLQGSGKLKIRAYRVSANSTTTSSSAILGYGYAGTNPTTCNVPGFLPVPGVLGDAGTVNVALNGTSACELRYRTDGTDPGASDPLWASSQVTLANGITNIRLRAISTAVNTSIMSPVMEGSWSCPNCTQAVVQSIAASGAIDVEVTAGMSTGLGVQLSGATSSQVVWTLEDGSAYAGLVAGGSTAQVNAYATLPTGVTSANVVVRASISGTDKFVKFNVKVVASGSTTNSSITAAGSTSFPMNPGNTTWLTASVTGVDPSLVVWSIESGADYASFLSTASGSTVQLQTISALPAGVSNPVVTVKAMIAGTTKSVLYNITVSGTGTSSATLVASGSTTIPVTAGTSVQLSTTVTGALPSDVSWSIESGNAYASFPSATTGTVVQVFVSSDWPTALTTPVVVKAEIPGTTNVVRFTLNVAAVESSIYPNGSGTVNFAAGTSSNWLYATVNGATSSDVVWSIESGASDITLTGSGTTAQVGVNSSFVNGTSLSNAVVVATLAGTTKTARFNLSLSGGMPASFSAMNTTNQSIDAGGILQLNTQVGGLTSPSISWSVMSGPGTVVGNGLSANYYAPSGTAASQMAVVRATLANTGKYVDFSVTINPVIVETLQIEDSTLMAYADYYPTTQAAKYFQVRRGTALLPTATWTVAQYPAGGTWSLYAEGSGIRFKPTMVGDYKLVASGAVLTDTVTVHWPAPETIEVNGAGTFELAPGERQQLMVTTTPVNAAVQWSLQGTSIGKVEPFGFYSYYEAPALTQLPESGAAQMVVRATLASDVNKYVDFVVNVHTKPLEFRDNGGNADTVYSVSETASSFYLAAWKNGFQATAAQWTLLESPAGAANPAFTQTDGAIYFQGTGTGRYRFKVTDGGYVSTVAIDWGTP